MADLADEGIESRAVKRRKHCIFPICHYSFLNASSSCFKITHAGCVENQLLFVFLSVLLNFLRFVIILIDIIIRFYLLYCIIAQIFLFTIIVFNAAFCICLRLLQHERTEKMSLNN